MKKITIITAILIFSQMAGNCQLNVSGSAGLAYYKEISSISGAFEIGYKSPANDCPQYGSFTDGLFISGGFISMLDAAAPATFYFKGGKSFVIGYGQQIELSAGYGWRLVSNDDKSRNSKAPIYSLSLVNSISDKANWILNITGGKQLVSVSIGMRLNFVNYKKY